MLRQTKNQIGIVLRQIYNGDETNHPATAVCKDETYPFTKSINVILNTAQRSEEYRPKLRHQAAQHSNDTKQGRDSSVAFMLRKNDSLRMTSPITANGNHETSGTGFWPGVKRVHADENGKITLITTITLMFFLLLVCYIGNVGISVRQKMELQNAADSAAYSVALTQARGMNAITVSNHMLGEATAIVVMLEALGGEKTLEKMQYGYDSQESARYNNLIKTLQETAPMIPPLRNIDKKIVDFVADLLTDDEGKHDSGATIYDAKLTLKYVFTLVLVIKTACTIGEGIGRAFPPLVFLEIIFSAIDIAMTLGPALKVAQEFLFLEALEAVSLVMVPLHRTVETILIPAISIYGATVAGQSPLTLPDPLASGESVVNRSAEKTLEDLSKFYAPQKIELVMLPAVNKLTLPVEVEKPPLKKGGSGSSGAGNWEMPPSQWEGPFFTNPAIDKITSALNQVNQVTGTATRVIGWLLDVAKWIPGLNTGPIKEAREKIKDLVAALALDVPAPDYRRGYPENPSHHPNSDFRLPDFYWESERKSQWVRATYPYVESYREPMIYWMQNGFSIFDLEMSNAATYYTHWTNRFTLAKSWQIRSGENESSILPTPKIFIMKSSEPNKKGYENWVTDDTEAEDLFVVYGIANRPPSKSFFGSVLFPKSKSEGSIAMAAAMIYNANAREVPLQGSGNATLQLDNGWDTLNWLPPVQAHEWGGQKPDNSNGKPPWQVLGGKLSSNRGSQVQINWQAKLVPLTLDNKPPKKLEKSIDNAGTSLSVQIKKQAKKALEQPKLIKH